MERAYDLVRRGGQVFDGSGSVGFEADVAVKDGRLVRGARSAPAAMAAE